MHTLARCFQQELALPFSHWRLQLWLARLAERPTASLRASETGRERPAPLLPPKRPFADRGVRQARRGGRADV